MHILENHGSTTNANDLGTVLHSADLLLAVLYAVAPTPAMSVTQPLGKIAATVVNRKVSSEKCKKATDEESLQLIVTKPDAAIRFTLENRSIMLCLFVDFSRAFDTVWTMGVLYKLSLCGVRGTMLRWLQSHLKDKPFKVFLEGTYSQRG
ncbi:hypothetical protein FHG87_003082 [Trinorchestia longiramus]|nr:hypothetical protein FHG87_003082 [Trinorchestia longiramus]